MYSHPTYDHNLKQRLMSKKSKQVQSVPDIYKGLVQRPNHRTICVVEDMSGVFSLFNNLAALEKLQSFQSLIKDTLSKTWNGLDGFINENKQTILAYHEQLFQAEPPKDQDMIITTINTWNKIIQSAKNDLTTEIPTSASGRVSTIGTRKYFYGEHEDDAHAGTGELKTPQALACLRLFRRHMLQGNTENDRLFVTEESLKQFVIENATELKTRQDPWRIFQYYRPELLKQKLLKHN